MTFKRVSNLEETIHSKLDSSFQSTVKFFCYDQVSSVLDVAREIVAPTLSKGQRALILANTQTQGRGQQGRSWVPVEKAFLGCILIPDCGVPKSELSAFSLVVAVQIALILKEYGVEVGVKWPNDVLSRKLGKKISGVLLEADSSTLGSDLLSLRIGIGVNFSGSPPEGTSIQQEVGSNLELDLFAAKLTQRCLLAFELYQINGFKAFERQWSELDLLCGKTVHFQQAGKDFHGVGLGVDTNGQLAIEVEGKSQSFASGQIIKFDLFSENPAQS